MPALYILHVPKKGILAALVVLSRLSLSPTDTLSTGAFYLYRSHCATIFFLLSRKVVGCAAGILSGADSDIHRLQDARLQLRPGRGRTMQRQHGLPAAVLAEGAGPVPGPRSQRDVFLLLRRLGASGARRRVGAGGASAPGEAVGDDGEAFERLEIARARRGGRAVGVLVGRGFAGEFVDGLQDERAAGGNGACDDADGIFGTGPG